MARTHKSARRRSQKRRSSSSGRVWRFEQGAFRTRDLGRRRLLAVRAARVVTGEEGTDSTTNKTELLSGFRWLTLSFSTSSPSSFIRGRRDCATFRRTGVHTAVVARSVKTRAAGTTSKKLGSDGFGSKAREEVEPAKVVFPLLWRGHFSAETTHFSTFFFLFRRRRDTTQNEAHETSGGASYKYGQVLRGFPSLRHPLLYVQTRAEPRGSRS